MIYKTSITIPANTTKAAPTIEILGVVTGVVKRVWVFLPWGCANLVGVQIWRGGWQVWPTSRQAWFAGNDMEWEFEETYRLEAEPKEFNIRGYNLDTLYPHTVEVAVSMQPDKVVPGLEDFLSLFGEGG